MLPGSFSRTPRTRPITYRVGVLCLLLSIPVLAGMGLPPPGGDPNDGGGTAFESEVVDQIGLFTSPSRIALSTSGQLYVSDTARGAVAIYDTSGVRVGTLKDVTRPLGVAVSETTMTACVDDRGEPGKCKKKHPATSLPGPTYAWVGDESDGSVRVFQDGTFTGFLGSGSGEFTRPNAIAVTSDAVYVVDSGTHQIRIYDGDGSYVGSFGSYGSGNGQLDFPADIAINEGTAEIYVADFNNHRIAVFDLGGAWVRNISAPPNDAGDPIFFRPSGLGIDPGGDLYVVDGALSCLVVMDGSGALIDVFGYQNGSYWTGELKIPVDAVSDGTRVYVTSSKHRHINVFEVSR